MRTALAALALAATLPLLPACESTPTKAEMRPGVSDLVVGDRGPQSKDLVQMTDTLAADILKIPEIARNPEKIAIVFTGIENKTVSERGMSHDIYGMRMRGLLNKYARDRLLFVEKRNTTANLQATEGAGVTDPFEDASRGPGQAPTRYVPQYALKGEFMDMAKHATTYYLFTFQLTNIKTGEIVWEGMYETRTLNY